MKFTNERILDIIPKGKNSEIVVRQEMNEFNETVVDIRLRNRVEELWMYTRHGITYPIFLNDALIEALSKIQKITV